MTEQTKTVTWETLLANVAQPETYTIRRATRGERLYQSPPATVTMPPNLDAQHLRDSLAALPDGLRADFTMQVSGRAPAMYVIKRAGGVTSHWATYALHIDPVYGQFAGRELPRHARKWLGRTPWATALMIAHEVPAWCLSSYPDPRTLPVNHLVSDMAGISRATIDPILYGVVAAGQQWAFVPLAEWRL
jgi:hypothetical protein